MMNDINDENDMDESVFSGIEYDSAVVWSDDPENAYFKSMLRRDREEEGREIEGSLIGESTLADLMDDPLSPTECYDPPHMKFTGSTSYEGESTIEQLAQIDDGRPAVGNNGGGRRHRGGQPRKSNETSATPARGAGALGWFTKHLPSVSSRSTSSHVPSRPNPFTQYTPTTTITPSGTINDKNIHKKNKKSIHLSPPAGMTENGVEIPELIFVNPSKSSAITTTSDPNQTKQGAVAASEGKRCTSRRVLLFLAICVLIAVGIMAYMLTQYRFKKNESRVEEQQQNTNNDEPTTAPIFDIPDDEGNNNVGTTRNPTMAPAPTVPVPPSTTMDTSNPTLSPTTNSGGNTIGTVQPSPTEPPVDPIVVPDDDTLLSRIVSFSPSSATALSNPNTPQRRAMDWLEQDPDYATYGDTQILQRWVLSTFYHGASGPQWDSFNGWQSQMPECSWSGIECDENDMVTKIELYENNIVGSLPMELSLLSNSLKRIAMDSNQISSTIPTEYGRLTRLEYFQMSRNLLTGTFPSEIGLMDNCRFLGFRRNDLRGSLPSNLGRLSLLRNFDVANNDMNGPIPNQYGSLTRLGTFDLSGNRFSGGIPSALGQLSQIQNFKLGENDLTGEVPSEVCFTDSDPEIRADCREVYCPCCTQCCVDGDGCDDVVGEVTRPPQGAQSVPAPTEKPVTTNPTKAPVTPATSNPTMAPEIPATPNPTRAPVTAVTPNPTKAPVTPATPNPTKAPVTPATSSPTKAPVTPATTAPVSSSFTAAPVTQNTPAPVPEVTSAPTIKATSSPTNSPTPSPITSNPTPSPVDIVTSEPTRRDTEEPTIAPIPAPATSSPTTPCVDSITADQQCYENGDDIIFTFQNCQPLANDWIGVYHISDDESQLGDPIAWVWTCGDQFCQEVVGSGQVTFYSVQGRGRYKAFIVRNSDSTPYEWITRTPISFRVGQSCFR